MKHVIEKLICEPKTKTLVAGFDGFIDTIARIAQTKDAKGNATRYYEEIPELGQYLSGQGGKSCSLELEITSKRLGGNAPLLSRGATALGMAVTLIGMLGKEQSDTVFESLNCKKYSYAAAGESTALEFHDGKIFLAPRILLEEDSWSLIEQATNGQITKMLQDADIAAMLNWSELDFSHALWKDALEKAIKKSEPSRNKYVFFDLCDCNRKNAMQIKAVLQLIGAYSSYRKTILSLNKNEAEVIASRVLNKINKPVEVAECIRTTFGIDEVIIHSSDENILATEERICKQKTRFVQKPLISTGAGDTFNAGFCYGTAMELSDEERLAFAGFFVNAYITSGECKTLKELYNML